MFKGREELSFALNKVSYLLHEIKRPQITDSHNWIFRFMLNVMAKRLMVWFTTKIKQTNNIIKSDSQAWTSLKSTITKFLCITFVCVLLLLLAVKCTSCEQFRILVQFLPYYMLNFRTPLLNGQPLLSGQLAVPRVTA